MTQRKLFDPKQESKKLNLEPRQPKLLSDEMTKLKRIYDEITKLEQAVGNNSDFKSRLQLMDKYDEFINKSNSNIVIKHDIYNRKFKNLVHSLIKQNRTKFLDYNQEIKIEWLDYLNIVSNNYQRYLAQNPKLNTKIICKILIALGDISRYQAMYLLEDKADAILGAKSYYFASQILNPSSGHVSSLLGVSSLIEEDLMNSCCYYFMAIHAKQSYSGAHDSLMDLFSHAIELDAKQGFQEIIILALRMVYILYTKIDLDTFPKLLETFRHQLKLNINETVFNSDNEKYQFWFSLGIVVISTLNRILSIGHEQLILEKLTSCWSKMISTILNECLKYLADKRYFIVFANIVLGYIIQNQMMDKIRLPNTLLEMIDSINADFSSVWKPNLPEDALISNFSPLESLGSSIPLNMKLLRFDFGIELEVTRKARFSKLVGFLAHFHPEVFVLAMVEPELLISPGKIPKNSFGVTEIDFEDLEDSNYEKSADSDTSFDKYFSDDADPNISIEFQTLKVKKDALVANIQNKKHDNIESIVFDTNCWLNNLNELKNIIFTKKWTIIVPTTGK